MGTYITKQGDMVDLICFRLLGASAGQAERTYELNPGLARHGPVLPIGLQIQLPDKPSQDDLPMISLWGE